MKVNPLGRIKQASRLEREENNMTIREYAKEHNFKVIGKLTRHPELEYYPDSFTGEMTHMGCKVYIDDGKNEYYVGKRGVCIVTADGDVI